MPTWGHDGGSIEEASYIYALPRRGALDPDGSGKLTQHGWILLLAGLAAYGLSRMEGIGNEVHSLVSRHRFAGVATAICLMAIHTTSSVVAPQGEHDQDAYMHTASKTFESAY